jgi:hypothetical protein
MGLTIHYTLSIKKGSTFGCLHDLLKGTARLARKIGCPHVGKVLHSTETDPTAPPFFETYPGCERRLAGGPGTHGWLVEVWPGEGCETAEFGVLRERGKIPSHRRKAVWPPRYRTRWTLHSFCKTQYAGELGWEHFLKCHLRVIHLLDYWREMGAQVNVHDEGGYWKSRSEGKLRQELDDDDRLIAGLGGLFKDACDASGGGRSVESPIFGYRNFERLEHEARQQFGGRIQPRLRSGPM